MNITKRAIAFALASVFTFGTLAFADNSVNITQRDSYIDKDGNGNLRFVSEVNLDAGKTIEKFGTWIVPQFYLDKGHLFGGDTTVDFTGDKGDLQFSTDKDGKQTAKFTADIKGIPAGLIDAEFYAKSYIEYAPDEPSATAVPVISALASSSAEVRDSEIEEENYTPTYYTPEPTEEPTPEPTTSFETKFVNRDKYLYRVGNSGDVALGTLFKAKDGVTIDSAAVTVSIAAIDGTAASGVYNANTSDWTKGKITFSGTGVVKVTINDGGIAEELLLEVVEAVNATGAASATANNVVLLNDVGFSAVTVSNGYAIYGNGFKMTSSSDIPGRYMSYGFVTLDNGILDNVQIICPNFSQQFLYTSDNAYKNSVLSDGTYPNSRCGVSMSGSSKIVNSYISGGRAAVYVTGVDQQIINSTINGGALANIHISSANSLLLRDVTTIQVPTQATVNDTSKTLLGLGVLTVCEEDGTSTPITLEGTLKQYNWANSSYSSYVPSAARFILTSALSQSSYKHNFNGSDWVNLGFAFLPFESGDPTTLNITDSRSDSADMPYGQISISGGKVYSYKNTNGTDESLKTEPEFSPNAYDFVAPHISFNGTSSLCTYNNGTKTLAVKLDDNNPSYTLDLRDVTVSKYGDIPYEIYENGTKVTESTVLLNSSVTKNYTLKFDDTVFYDKDGQRVVQTIHYEYPFTVAVTLTSLPAPVSLAPSTHDALVVASSYNGTWNIATPTLNGIKVKAWNSELDDWEEIDLSVFCPSKSGQQSTDKTITLTSSKGTLTVTAPNKFHSNNSIYGKPVVVDGELYFVPTSTSGLVNYGNGARSSVVDYIYKDTNNKSCTFSITFSGGNAKHDGYTQYKYSDFVNGTKTELTASSGGSSGGGTCVAEGTLITLADGSKKAVENLTGEEELLVWNLETGRYEAAPIVFVDSDDKAEYEIIRLNFSDGTSVDVITEHGFFDVGLGEYVYLDENAARYIGHRFVKYGNKANNSWNVVTLTSVTKINRVTRAYSPVTSKQLCYYVNDMLSMPGGISGLFNIFTVNAGTMTYDKAQMAADIKNYGLFTYDDFRALIPIEVFEVFNGQYLKIAIEKGMLTWDDIAYLAERYAPLVVSE